jgi:hypothetical protein
MAASESCVAFAPHGVTRDGLTLPHLQALPAGPTVMSSANGQHRPS